MVMANMAGFMPKDRFDFLVGHLNRVEVEVTFVGMMCTRDDGWIAFDQCGGERFGGVAGHLRVGCQSGTRKRTAVRIGIHAERQAGNVGKTAENQFDLAVLLGGPSGDVLVHAVFQGSHRPDDRLLARFHTAPDSFVLQQDGFDAVDSSVPIQSQQEAFALLQRLIGREYHFTNKEQVRDYFTRLTGLVKNLNYAPTDSDDYGRLTDDIEQLDVGAVLAEKQVQGKAGLGDIQRLGGDEGVGRRRRRQRDDHRQVPATAEAAGVAAMTDLPGKVQSRVSGATSSMRSTSAS